jgi:predicted XRE-type DNA-binding protein
MCGAGVKRYCGNLLSYSSCSCLRGLAALTDKTVYLGASSIARSSGTSRPDANSKNIARHAEQELMKAQLTLQIYRIMKRRGMTQSAAAKVLGIRQPHVSLLMRNRAGTFSVGRLMAFLTALGHDVEITVRPTRREHGEMTVNPG